MLSDHHSQIFTFQQLLLSSCYWVCRENLSDKRELNPVVIVTGSMQNWKCPRGACRYHAQVFQKRHLLFKIAARGGKKSWSPHQRCNRCYFVTFLPPKLSRGQCERLVQPHIFFYPTLMRSVIPDTHFGATKPSALPKGWRTTFVTPYR